MKFFRLFESYIVISMGYLEKPMEMADSSIFYFCLFYVRHSILIKKRKKLLEETISEPPKTPEQVKEFLYNRVTPLWKMPYEEQLVWKMKKIRRVLNTCGHRLKSFGKSKNKAARNFLEQRFDKFLRQTDDEEDDLLSPLREIHRSPITIGYRNKYEFAIGRNYWGQVTVGFALGAYRDGTISVQVGKKTLLLIFSECRETGQKKYLLDD
jgi:hypothetical protein